MQTGFHVGEEVVLKSGGSRMAIQEIRGGDALCIWQSGKGTEERWFPVAVLRKAPPRDIPRVV
jgi:uncharacterized protein YodC (DUF2158 family)